MNEEILIPVAFFAMVFGIFYVRSRENMAMIERGLNPRNAQQPRKGVPATAMRYGLILLGAGIGLMTAYMIDLFVIPSTFREGGVAIHRDTEPLYFSLLGIGGGLGLIIAYVLERKADKADRKTEE